MRIPLIGRSPDPQAEILSEALSLYEDGMEITAILALYDEADRGWLRPLLSTGEIIRHVFEEEEASFYFEASLKAKFLAAAEPVIGGEALPAPAASPLARFGGMRTSFASLSVVLVAGALGVLSFGLITSGDAVPGEWNYAFKRATEQAQSSFARGDERINVQIRQTEERIDEIQTLVARGALDAGHIDRLTRELGELLDLAADRSFDPVQQAKVRSLSDSTVAVLAEAEEDLAPAATGAIEQANEVVAAVAAGGVSGLEEPSPTAEPTVEPTTPAEPEPTATPEPTSEPEPAATPEATAEPEPTATEAPPAEEPEATATAEPTAVPEDPTVADDPTTAPDPTVEPSPSPETP